LLPQFQPLFGDEAIAQHASAGYFAQFGIDDRIMRVALLEELSRGADFADVFVQHKTIRSLVLQDGILNRGSIDVTLGVGVRAVKEDRSGYGYSETLSLNAIREAAAAVASIAAGVSRPIPHSFRIAHDIPQRYPISRSWADVKIDDLSRLLSKLNAEVFAADNRIKKVKLDFERSSQSS